MLRRVPASVRFVAVVFGLVVVFGGGASLLFGAFDKSQTNGSDPLNNLVALLRYDAHFFQQVGVAATTGTTLGGVPLHTAFLIGLATTIEYCFIAMPIALALGLLLALMSRSDRPIVRIPARAFVEFFRNTPLVVQALAIYYALPLPNWFLTFFTAGVTVLALNYAAYECENFRAGLAALDRGQGEAAATLGLSYWQTLRLVIFPQIVPIVLPPVINDLIFMYKDSAVLSLIAVVELTATTRILVREQPGLYWQIFLIGGLLYLAVSLPLSRVARSVESRLKSTAFAIKRDLSVAAVQVLAVMVAVGWLFGLVVQGVVSGITVSNIFGNDRAGLIQLVLALALALMLLGLTMLILGGITYGINRLFAWIRTPRRALPTTGASQPAAVIE